MLNLRFCTFTFLGLAFATTLGCSRSPSSVEPKKILRVQLVNEPMSLDPTLAEDGVSLQILNNIARGLVGYDGEGKLQKQIAESYTISDDGKKYTFTLRKDVRWSDGQPVRIHDFISALRRALSPVTTCRLAPMFFPIRGARSYHERKSSVEALGVREENEKLIIELERRTPYFIQALTLPPALPIREDILKANQGVWPESAPVTGPYRIASHQVNEKIILERNPNYWGELPSILRVDLWIIVDESTATNLFESGQLDILTRIPSLDFARLKKQGRVYTTPFLATYYLSFNCKKPPFQDRNWRRAISGAIRRDEIAKTLDTGELPAWSWIPKGLEGYLPYQDPKPVFADSISLLKKRKADGKPVTAAFDSGARNSKILEKVQQDVNQALGLKLSLTNFDWRTYVKTIQADPPSLFRFGWLAPFLDPISHLKVFRTGNLNNNSGCSNSQYDLLVDQIEGMEPGVEREAKIRAAQKILLEDEAAVIPLYHYVQNTGISARVRGLRVNPFGVIHYEDLSLE